MSDLDAKTQLSLVDYLVLTVLDGVGESARLDMNKITNMWSFPFFSLQSRIINLEINLPECVENHCKQNKFS